MYGQGIATGHMLFVGMRDARRRNPKQTRHAVSRLLFLRARTYAVEIYRPAFAE